MQYFWITIKHKWFVLLAGLKTKAPLWRLIIHDWSKFTPSELPHYQRQFFGPANDPEGFAECWIHHQNRNPHHWEYWIPRTGGTLDSEDNKPVPMPVWAVREMVADWMGASRAYEGKWPEDLESWNWFQNGFPKIIIHPITRNVIHSVMSELFFDKDLRSTGKVIRGY